MAQATVPTIHASGAIGRCACSAMPRMNNKAAGNNTECTNDGAGTDDDEGATYTASGNTCADGSDFLFSSLLTDE